MIVDIDFQSALNRALITFEKHFYAELSLKCPVFCLKGYTIRCKQADPNRNGHYKKHLMSKGGIQGSQIISNNYFKEKTNLIIKNLNHRVQEH